jgi:hypothetical protein
MSPTIPRHVAIGTHEQSGGGHVADGASGRDGEQISDIGNRSRHHATLGEIKKQWPPIAGELGNTLCSVGVCHTMSGTQRPTSGCASAPAA